MDRIDFRTSVFLAALVIGLSSCVTRARKPPVDFDSREFAEALVEEVRSSLAHGGVATRCQAADATTREFSALKAFVSGNYKILQYSAYERLARGWIAVDAEGVLLSVSVNLDRHASCSSYSMSRIVQ
jgi:hypothetical protein